MQHEITLAVALILNSVLAVAGDKASDATGQMWDQADANRDGYVSKEEASAVSPGIDFMASDKNTDGRVSRDEYAAAQAIPRASDGSKNQARASDGFKDDGAMEIGAAGRAGPESEK